MPYKLSEDGKCVMKADTGETVKCHDTHEEAVAHMQALMINVDKTTEEGKPAEKIGRQISARNLTKIQAAHDALTELGAMCQSKNSLKAISETDDELRVGNYIVLFGGRDLEGLGSPRVNPDGSKGEYFAPEVDLESSYTKTGRLHVDWEHGQDPDNIGNDEDEILGYVDWKTARKDETGWYVERVLFRRAKYMQWLEGLIKEGLIGNSTQAVPKAVKKNSDGGIVRWPMKRDTLTVNPMEPRMLTENSVIALKALHIEIPSEAAKSDKGDPIQPSSKEKTIMEKEELQTMLDEQRGKITADFDNKVKEAVDTALKALPEVKTSIAVTQDPADVPFKSLAEQFKAVKDFTTTGGRLEAPRLKYLDAFAKERAQKAPQGMSEGTNADGGFLLEPTISPTIMKPVHDAGPFYAGAAKLPVGGNSESGWINGVNESSRANGSRWGGVLGYHRSEVGTVTATHPTFRRINWQLDWIDCLMYLTDSLMADAPQVEAIARQAALEELGFIANNDIFRGDGVGKCLGIAGHAVEIAPTRQTLLQVNNTDILNMWQRILPRSRSVGQWYINSEVEPQLDRLAMVSNAGTTEMEPRYVTYGPDGVLRIKGRPVTVTEFNEALGTRGDICFWDMSQYLCWEKGGGESINPWISWLTHENAIRLTLRLDGQPALASAITPFKGSNTQSPFVALATSTS